MDWRGGAVMAFDSKPLLCGGCSSVLPHENFHRSMTIARGYQNYCKKCHRDRHIRSLGKRRTLNAKLEWAKMSVWSARYRSKKKGIECSITAEYVVSISPDFCPVFGFKLNYVAQERASKHVGSFDSPSIDRIDPNKGYVVGNVSVISRRANMSKNDCSVGDIEKLLSWMKSNA